MDILSIFAERLKELIIDGKTSPEKISDDLKHNVFDIYHWMSSNNKYMPSVANIVKLANYFKCSVDFLIGLTEDAELPNIKLELPKFSERFVYVLKKQGFNLYKLGKATGTSTTTYYRWINDIVVPTIDSLVKVSKALDCSVDFLLGRVN